jgi:CHAT domain-containing protein
LQVLVTQKPEAAVPLDPTIYARTAWLVRLHAITVLPSIASLKSLRAAAGKSPAAKPYIAFGNPLLTGPDSTDKRAWDKQTCADSPKQHVASARGLRGSFGSLFRDGLGNVEELRKQDPLPESADELCAVARDLKATDGDVYLGGQATERTIKGLSQSGDLRTRAIVHFATHGLLAGETESLSESLAEPALLLTPPEVASEEDDGLLTASEVAQLDLNAEWVILSACNTAGANDTVGAEPLSGLARAFFYAGARALLVSHWYVDSDGAVKLTTRAVAELRGDAKTGRAEALRRSILALMADTSRPANWTPAAHPSVWAPFVVVGEGR